MRGAVAMATVLLVLTVAGAGAGAADDARELLREGMLALASSPGLTATLSLDTDAASLRALLDTETEELTPQAVEVFATTSVQVTFPLAVSGDWFGMSVRSAGVDWAELRAVDGVLYGRLDLRAWWELVDADPALLDDMQARIEEGGVLPPDVLGGRWIAVTEPDGMLAAAAAEHDNALGRLGLAIVDSGEVELVGSDERGDHLRVAVSLRTLRDALALELSALTPGGAGDLGLPPSQSVPDEAVDVDLWVRDGFLVAARLDLMQMARFGPEHALPPGVERLAVQLQFQSFDGQVQAPADAFEVDGDALLGALMPEELPGDPIGEGEDVDGGDGTTWPDPTPRVPSVPRKTPHVSKPNGARPSAPLSLDALLGLDMNRQPRARPAAAGLPEAMEADAVLLDFYGRPGYGEARRRYCLQLDDVADAVWARHYSDICPGA